MLYLLLIMGGILLVIQEPQTAVNSVLLQSVSGWDVYDGCCGDIVLQIQMLLIIAGDVELNPGPLTPEELTRGLATLITQAPEGVRTVLGVWSPDKGDMVAEWNSNKFTVPVLREAMAWLQNSSVEEVGKRLKKKLDLAMAMAVEIERLLPDDCGSCQTSYTVGRVDKPTLQCAGCHQGIHEECLREVLGEATATLSTLHGSLTWLCQACAPNYRMMTVMVPGGTQRPVNRRLAARQVAAPPTQNSAQNSEQVDEISDRLAAISVSNSESATIPPPTQQQQQVEQGQVQAGAASDIVVLLLPTTVAVLVIVALAEIVKERLAHLSVGLVALSGTSAKLMLTIGVVFMSLQTVNHMLILLGEYFHLLWRVFRYRQSSPCWKPGWRVQGRT
jgi:hypothetical protein